MKPEEQVVAAMLPKDDTLDNVVVRDPRGKQASAEQ